MVEERKKARQVYGAVFLCLGVVLLLMLNLFLGTTIVSDKIDYDKSQVNSLFCTFERVPFYVEDVISTETGLRVIRVNITLGTELFQFYTYEASRLDFIDVGWLHWKHGQLLAFHSERLEDGMNYVVDLGRITYLNLYGVYNGETLFVEIYEIHQRNWFDELASNSPIEISLLIGFAFVFTCSLLCLPLMEFHINYEIEKRMAKKGKGK